MTEVAVEVEGATKSFGQVRALDGVSLKVQRGELYGLLGPNGSGKTTLIRMLVGLVSPDSGQVRVLGSSVPNLGVLNRVGYMTQQAALYPDLSVLDNLRFFAALYGAEDSIEEALGLVELWDRRHSVVATLSGGMRTRCSLAVALVHHPDLLLLDEPTVGVDPQLRAQLWDHFREIAERGSAIIVSSHVMDEAERTQRLVMLLFGHLLAEGSAGDLRRLAGVDNLEAAFLKLSEGGR